MIICICHQVSDRDIARAARDGCASFDELQFELSVATCCGKCHDCARETFDRHAAQVRQAAPVLLNSPARGAHAAGGRVIPIAPGSRPHHGSTASAAA